MAIKTCMFYSLCYLLRKVFILIPDKKKTKLFLHNKELGTDLTFLFLVHDSEHLVLNFVFLLNPV